MVNLNYTPIFDSISDEVHYNVSYMIANQPPLVTTQWVWIIFSLAGVLFLIYSVKHHEDMEGDITGIMASAFLLVSALQSFAVDTVTSSGVAVICEELLPSGVCNKEEWVAMEGHQIYHYDLWGFLLAGLFVLSAANLVLLWLRYRRVSEQAKMDAQRPRMSKPDGEEKDEKEK